ncbi:Na+/H+ antiporter subunit E [Acidovorax sp. FG27]|uniref:Na+/H+ antiporter subunit E n=1 Tax=Acidovorax sp. FG27 TaxID=3133652 RepID=UPI0030EAE03B
MIRSIFPAPLLSVALFGMWLLLNGSLSAGHLVLALLVAVIIPVLTRGLRPLPVRIRKPGTVLRLALNVLIDTSVSNLAVSRFLAFKSLRRHSSGFVHIPLELRDPNALAVLAVIVCITPGTSWAELSLDRSVLLLHALEVGDPQELIDHIKTRYERPLMEIFE